VFTTIYHVTDGPQTLYTVDANEAVARSPREWSRTPWYQSPQKADDGGEAVKADDGGVAIKAVDTPVDTPVEDPATPAPSKKK